MTLWAGPHQKTLITALKGSTDVQFVHGTLGGGIAVISGTSQPPSFLVMLLGLHIARCGEWFFLHSQVPEKGRFC